MSDLPPATATIDVPAIPPARNKAVWAEALNHHGQWVMGVSGENRLPWPPHPEDLKHFAEATKGHVMVMGRNTWRSLPAGMRTNRSLADRPAIILTSSEAGLHEVIDETRGLLNAQPVPVGQQGFKTAGDIRDAAFEWFGLRPLAVIGGARAIEFMAPVVDTLEVTVFDRRQRYDGDVLAPSGEFLEGYREAGQRALDTDLTLYTYERM